MAKKEVKKSAVIFLIMAAVLFGVGFLKRIDATSMQSLKDSCTQDFENISQSECTMKYELMSDIHEEVSRNAALFCVALGMLALGAAAMSAERK